MWEDCKRGSLPCPNLTNMEIYYDIGLELNLGGMEAVTDDIYRSRYEEKLAIWNRTSPIVPDPRLWQHLNSAPMRAA